jgi:hypothetical protein
MSNDREHLAKIAPQMAANTGAPGQPAQDGTKDIGAPQQQPERRRQQEQEQDQQQQ